MAREALDCRFGRSSGAGMAETGAFCSPERCGFLWFFAVSRRVFAVSRRFLIGLLCLDVGRFPANSDK
jgi:hypothetical protein